MVWWRVACFVSVDSAMSSTRREKGEAGEGRESVMMDDGYPLVRTHGGSSRVQVENVVEYSREQGGVYWASMVVATVWATARWDWERRCSSVVLASAGRHVRS